MAQKVEETEYTFNDTNAEASGNMKRTLGIFSARHQLVKKEGETVSRSEISGLINAVKAKLNEPVDSNYKIENPELPATKKQYWLLGTLTCTMLNISTKGQVDFAIKGFNKQ